VKGIIQIDPGADSPIALFHAAVAGEISLAVNFCGRFANDDS